MKTPLACMLLTLGALPSAARAAPPQEAHVRLDAGPLVATPLGTSTANDLYGPTFGASAAGGYRFTESLSGNLGLRYFAPQQVRSDAFELEYSMWQVCATGRLSRPLGRLLLHGEAGYVIELRAVTGERRQSDMSASGMIFGAGVGYRLSPTIGLATQLDYVTTFGDFLERGWVDAVGRIEIYL